MNLLRKKIQINNMLNKSKGFSLIELMVAMVIGVIILLGLVSLFSSSSALNRTQTGLAVLQENGRYAISRLKSDIESAGRKHCVTVDMPSTVTTSWNQGYEMASWTVDRNVTFTNGFPNFSDIVMDTQADGDQLGDIGLPGSSQSFPLDPSYFIQGHECDATACTPSVLADGQDINTVFGNLGSTNGTRPASTDILTMSYLNSQGGDLVTGISGNTLTLESSVGFNDIGLIADCYTSYVSQVNGTTVNGSIMPTFDLLSETRLYNLAEDFKTVSYYLQLDTDINNPSRLISSLYRSENGIAQLLVEGVERFDVFYLAQMQTGEIVRMDAQQIAAVSGGGPVSDDDGDGIIEDPNGCIVPPRTVSGEFPNLDIANDPGCLWRSVYAIEVHLLLNTVNDSSQRNDDVFTYTPDGLMEQTPSATLPSGIPSGRMYRREFTAIVPVRSYTL